MKPFRNRLSQYVTLADDVWDMVETLGPKTRVYGAGEDIIRAGEKADTLFVIEQGWALRYRLLEDGRRQIVNFMLPGDLFDLQALADLDADHSVTTVTETTVQLVEAKKFVTALRRSGDVATAFWWSAVQEESILREQIVRIGRRSARERIGHLLLELQRRISSAHGGEMENLPMPLTRTDIADALGLTPIHVSRTMSDLRRNGLIEESRSSVRITDYAKLAEIAHFDPDYLHLRRIDFTKGSFADIDL